MTATEYLKEKDRRWKRRVRLSIYGPFSLAIAAMLAFGIALACVHTYQLSFYPGPLAVCIGLGVTLFGNMMAGGWMFGYLGNRRYAAFIIKHPEMKHLARWTEVVPWSESRYPTSPSEKAALRQEVPAELERRGRRANAGFELREAVMNAIGRYCRIDSGSIEAGVAGPLLVLIDDYVGGLDNDYFAYRDLVMTMGILPEYLSAEFDPQKFRESVRRASPRR